MCWIAWTIREGNFGTNEEVLRFNQPRGQVTTTSSKERMSPEAVVMDTEGALLFSTDVSILTTFVESLTSAVARAFDATFLSIAE